jgi:hypothetical protein
VYEGSFLDFDWSDGDVIFANSTCFSDELMTLLSKQAESLKPGAIVVTFTKGMSTPAFELLERKRYRMSWGPATGSCFVIKKFFSPKAWTNCIFVFVFVLFLFLF